MRTRALLLAAVLLVAGNAQGALKALEEARELPLNAATLPPGDTGQLVVRGCPTCKPEVLRVTAETRCFVRPSKAAVPLREARKAAAAAATRPAALLYVYYDPKTLGVRRLVVDPGP